MASDVKPDFVSRCGRVELYNSDCRDVMPEVGLVGSIITDPPYGMSFRSNRRAVKHDAISGDDDFELLKFACGLDAIYSKYVFCRWDALMHVPMPKSVINWVKNNHGTGDLAHEHARTTEQILFYPGEQHYWNGKRPTDVVYADKSLNELHPTEKTPELMGKIIQFSGPSDQVICDPFMGAGATGVAAIRLGHKFIGIELNPDYYKIAARRIELELNQRFMF